LSPLPVSTFVKRAAKLLEGPFSHRPSAPKSPTRHNRRGLYVFGAGTLDSIFEDDNICRFDCGELRFGLGAFFIHGSSSIGRAKKIMRGTRFFNGRETLSVLLWPRIGADNRCIETGG
jgi:hypothetical protein